MSAPQIGMFVCFTLALISSTMGLTLGAVALALRLTGACP